MRLVANTWIVLATLLLIQGCDITGVIDRTEPSTSVPQKTVISTEDGARALRAEMYDRFHASPAMNTDWMLGPAAQADNMFFRSSSGRHQGLNLNVPSAGVGTGVRDDVYDAVNDANLLIKGIEDGVLSEDVSAKFEAEARFIRALVMHHDVRIFGYDPMSPEGPLVTPNSGPGQGMELGDVLRSEPTLATEDVKELPRRSVVDVYDRIVSDLETAIELFAGLPDGVKEDSEFFATEVAAHALLARVHLYQRNYSGAETQAQIALDQANSRFGSGLAEPSNLMGIFDETTANPEAIFTIDTDPVTETEDGVNDGLSAYTTTQWVAQLPTQELIDLYPSNDQRKEAWYAPCFNEEENEVPAGCDNVNIEGLELQKYNAEQGNFADDYIHLRVAEMKLIQAEARLNGADGSPGEPLNDLRQARGLDDLSVGQVDLDEILDERRRELVAEGHRYFDLKRLGRDISKSQGKLDSPPQEDLPFNSYRVLDDFPAGQIASNPELQQNPGY